MKPLMITLWVKPGGLRKHEGDPKLKDIKVTNRLAQWADRVILQGEQHNHLVKDPIQRSTVHLGPVGPGPEMYANHHARHWPNDGAFSHGAHESRFSGEVVLVFDGGDDVSVFFDGLVQNNQATAKITAIRDAIRDAQRRSSCGPGNHLNASPICQACGVNVDDEQRTGRLQHLARITDLRQQLGLSLKPLAQEFVGRGVSLIRSRAEVKLEDSDVRAVITDTLSAVLGEEGF
jgi:hypothetical protein